MEHPARRLSHFTGFPHKRTNLFMSLLFFFGGGGGRGWGFSSSGRTIRAFAFCVSFTTSLSVLPTREQRASMTSIADCPRPCGIVGVTGQCHSSPSLRRAGAKRLERLRLPLSRIQFNGRWAGMSVLANVEEEMWESEGPLCLEHTWEELADQLVVAVDALSASVPPPRPLLKSRLWLLFKQLSVSSRRRTSRSLRFKPSLRMSRCPVRFSTHARAGCMQFSVFLVHRCTLPRAFFPLWS